MPQELLDYGTFSSMRTQLAREYEGKINMSPNAELVYKDVYGKKLETGVPETIAERMSAVSLDVASNDLRYLPEGMSLEQKLGYVTERARRYMEMQVDNIFRANTPTNINFGRWNATYDESGQLTGYEMISQLGSACFVIPVEDTFGDHAQTVYESDGILAAWVEQQLLQKGGGGTGLSGCALRPKGSILRYNPAVDGMKSMDWVHSRNVSSGFESFLEHYFNPSTDAVKQGNSRRGANMGIQRIDHMDFLDHIYAKFGKNKDRSEWRLKNFNLSMSVTDEFMEAATSGGMYTLYNPHRADPKIKSVLEKKFGVQNPEIVRKGDLATKEQFERAMKANTANPFAPVTTPNMYLADNEADVINAYTGEKIGTIMNDIVYINASSVLDIISKLSHSNGEPGIVFIDRINENNPILPVVEYDATNPCGEQPLPPHTACNLGSINAGKFAKYNIFDTEEEAQSMFSDPFKKIEKRGDGRFGVTWFNWAALDHAIYDGISFLDNVIDRGDFPTDKVTEAVARTRKVGLGYMGVYDAMVLMKIRYGSEDSFEFGEALAKRLHDKSRETSMKLAQERGVFPLWEESFFNPESEHFKWFNSNPTTIRDRFRGSRKLSDKVQRGRNMTYGIPVRNSYQTTQAPTGTIRRTVGESNSELGLENLAISSGIEPFFSLEEESKIINTKVKDFSLAAAELLRREGLYSTEIIGAIRKNRGSVHVYYYTTPEVAKTLEQIPKEVRDVLVTAAGGEEDFYEIKPEEHARMSSVFQKWTDSAISKTVNLPGTATHADIRDTWTFLWQSGCKGGTVYRDSSREFQILNVVSENRGLEGKTNGKKIKRPLLQRSITLELPYITSIPKEGVGEVDFDSERCFTTLTFNLVNGHLTGVFQNIPEVDPERISLLTSANIELSRTLKEGRPIDKVIKDLEKVSLEGSRSGIIVDEAVMNGSKDRLRYQVGGSTTRGDLLNALYVTKFLTDGGTNFGPGFIEERMRGYELGEITLRSIINTRGQIRIEEDIESMPSILGSRKVIKAPEGISEKLCPECG